MMGTIVRYKRCSQTYKSKGGKPDSLTLGKGTSVATIYGAGKKYGLTDNGAVTRIEVRLEGRDVPIRLFSELPTIKLANPKTLRYFDPFRHVTLQLVSLKNLNDLDCTVEQASRYGRLETLLKTGGYSYAKQHLNKNKHFARDYGCFLDVGPWPYSQPNDVLRRHLIDYFRGWHFKHTSLWRPIETVGTASSRSLAEIGKVDQPDSPRDGL
jgi:hypothetical protein